MNPIKSHPAASTAAGAGGLGVLTVWLLNRYLNAGLDAEGGALVAGAITTSVIFVGREGIRGAVRRLWSGDARESTAVTVEVSKVGDHQPQVEVTTTGTHPAAKAATRTRKPAAKKKGTGIQ